MSEQGIQKTDNGKWLPKSLVDEPFRKELLEFISAINTYPAEGEVLVNKFADNSRYIPIGTIEDKLNYYFGGLWQTKDFRYQVIVNEIVGDLQLGLYHPVMKEWIWRTGTGAVLIQQKAEYTTDKNGKRVKVPVDVLDVSRKIANTLVKDMGHLKAECIKNAAKSLGRQFGSHLNRDVEDGTALDNVKDIQEVLEELARCKTIKDLSDVYKQLPRQQANDKRVKQLFSMRKMKLDEDAGKH